MEFTYVHEVVKNGKALLCTIKGLNMEIICVVCSTCSVPAADIIHRMNHVTLRLNICFDE